MRSLYGVVALFVAVVAAPAQNAGLSSSSAAIYVSPSGNDRNPGTSAAPLATPAAAQKAVRKLRAQGLPAGGVTVFLDDGLYPLDHSLTLTKEDSGTPTSPVVWRALPGKHPRLFGGAMLQPAAFKPVTDPAVLATLAPAARGHILALRLNNSGLLPARYPDVFKGSGGMLQLLVDDAIQPLSRWPNAGYTTMLNVVDSGLVPTAHGGTFHYRPEVVPHAEAWAAAAKSGRLWLTGFWRVPFEVYTLRVASVDTVNHTITFAGPGLGSGPLSGIGSKYSDTVNGTRIGNGKEQYYATNLVEEIDHPGEWAYDFPSHTLYLWPPDAAGLAGHELLLAALHGPVIELDRAHDLTVQGLTIEGGLAQAVVIQNASHVLFAGNTVRNTAGGGVDVEGGGAVTLQSNDLYQLGDYGIHLVGGDRATLAAAHLVAENNHIHHFGQQERITEGIFLDGVGNLAEHNLIHDGPYNGIRFQGNDQLMQYNEVHHIGLDAGDMGIFYTNGDWAAQGDRILYNFGHDAPNANGAYLDDGSSGRLVYGNIFYKLASGLFLGGGHDNTFEDNLVIDCKTALHIDDRGVARKYDSTANHLTRFLKTINPNTPPWSVRYPNFLRDILADPTHPTANIVRNNALIDDGTPYQISPPAQVDPALNPVLTQPIGELDFKHPATLDLTPGPKSPIFAALPVFKATPMAGIGLKTDAYRTTLPTDAETGRMTDRTPLQSFDSTTDVKASDKLGAPPPATKKPN